MGRNQSNKVSAKDADGPVSPSPWGDDLDEFARELGLTSSKRRIGRHNTSVRFMEMRLKDRNIEMDYQFNSGGGILAGTMVVAYNRDEPIGLIVEKLMELGEEAFHNIRRSRD